MRFYSISLLIILSHFIEAQETDLLRDLSPDRLEELKEINLIDAAEKSLETENNLTETLEDYDDTQQLNSEKFGYDYFSKMPTSISSAADLPVPGEYKISLNDQLKVIFTGSKNEIFNLTVQLDGSIFIPKIGSISVVGDALSNVRSRVVNLVDANYVGVTVDVSIKELSAKKISIIGAVKSPGTYLVNPFTTISNALAYSGGVEDFGSLRNIVLVKPNGDEYVFDLYDLLIYGKRSNDLTVGSGDTIVVRGTDNFLEVKGSILRSKIYEYKKDDTFQDLIDFALGLLSEADQNNIYTTEVLSGAKVTKKINLSDSIGSSILKELYVGNNVFVTKNNLFVDGFGVTRGYVSSDLVSFDQIVSSLKFSSDIFPFYAIYDYQTLDGLGRKRTSFSLADPKTFEDFELNDNAKIYFFDRDFIMQMSKYYLNDSPEEEAELEIDAKYLLDIPIPSEFIQFKSANVNFLIPLKGKITPKILHEYFGTNEEIAEENVAVITKNESFSNSYTQIYDSKEVVAITLPKLQTDLIKVTILGQILNPGVYSLSSSTTLNELYVLAGGFLENSFEQGIIFARESVRENQEQAIIEARTLLVDSLLQKSTTNESAVGDINEIIKLAENLQPNGRITGNFSLNSDFSNEFILNDGDEIFIPSERNEITVEGEVLNSTSFLYDDSMSVSDYIDAAGGFSNYADKSAVFVIKANGVSIKVSRNIFSGNPVKLERGDTIVIPRDLEQISGLPLVQVATDIISNIAFSAASLNALKN